MAKYVIDLGRAMEQRVAAVAKSQGRTKSDVIQRAVAAYTVLHLDSGREAVGEVRDATALACADMIEHAARAVPYTGDFGEGYRRAQGELAEMLRRLARGEITAEACRERFGLPPGADSG